jgi:hypothetical protein
MISNVMGSLFQALKLIFEMYRKGVIKKITRKKKIPTYKPFFPLFGPLLLSNFIIVFSFKMI